MKNIKKMLNCIFCVMLLAFVAGAVLTSCPGNGKKPGSKQDELIMQTPAPTVPVLPEKPMTPDAQGKIDAGVTALGSHDYDAALKNFEEAYQAAPNNETKLYYALTQLAKISVKTETVAFMKNTMGFVKYPGTLKGLIDYKTWFKTYTYTYPGSIHTYSFQIPEVETADWFKAMPPISYILPALIENSSGNFDKVLDDVYNIIFGAEFNNAWAVINSLQDGEIPVKKDFLKGLGLDEDAIEHAGIQKVQKTQLQGIIGGLLVVRGGINFFRSYKLSTDISPFKFNWDSNDEAEILKNLLPYTQAKDPFANGFLTVRDASKMTAAKNDIVKGANLLIAAYDSLLAEGTIPAEAKKYANFTRDMVKKIADAINSGSTVDVKDLVNKVYPRPYPYNPKHDFTKFEINMGILFTPGAIKLSNLFEMNGTKPKIGTTKDDPTMPCFILTLKKFAKDFVVMQMDNKDIMPETFLLPLEGAYGKKIKEFYK